jgi:ADP-heptose:LPS heptosyltransferase
VKIAIFRACGVGDAVQLTPLFQQIRRDFPAAEVHFFLNDSVAPLLVGCPFLDRVESLPDSWLGTRAERVGLWKAWGQVSRRGPYDLLLFLDPRIFRALGSLRVKAERKIGFLKSSYRWLSLYTDPIYYDLDAQMHGRCRHMSEVYLQVWSQTMGRPDAGFGYNLRFLAKQPVLLPATLPDKYLVFAPGAGNAISIIRTKRWPVGHWLTLEHLLQEKGWHVVWLGSRLDAAEIPVPESPWNLMGKLDLRQAASVVSESRGVIANDSGLFHVALALGKKTVGFYGPTDPKHVGPFRAEQVRVLTHSLPCVPCWKDVCDWEDPALEKEERPYCLSQIRPEQAAVEILSLME